MRKANVIVVMAVAVVMLAAMTGIVAARPANVHIVDDPIINPLDGSTVTTTTVEVTHIDYTNEGNSHGRHISVETDNANLYARVTSGTLGVDTTWTNNVMKGDNYTAVSPNDYDFTLEVKGTQSGQVTVYDNAGNSFSYQAGNDFASCTRSVEVPEFATIALPAAAILGLVLFFNRRKHRKE